MGATGIIEIGGIWSMEKKTPNLATWRRVLQHRFAVSQVDGPHFHGYVTQFFIDKVTEPRIKQQDNRTWCIAADGFLWVQYFPDGCCHTIRTILNADHCVEQWYIDICRPYVLDDQGIPTYDDLDLDLVIWPDGQIELWDSDELEQSLRDGAISNADYEMAWTEARKLVEALNTGTLVLPKSADEVPRWVSHPMAVD